jgi:hypothetical protein
MTGSDVPWPRRLPYFPEKATCIDATNDWLALQCADDDDGARKSYRYLLYNPFSGTTVRLPEIDAIIGSSSEMFQVRRVVMRSTPSDVVAFVTNNYNYPIILVLPGKGVWLPRPRSAPFVYIIDIAFVGDKLYGITHAEDLISLAVAFDDDGKPTVTRTERVIRHATRSDDCSNVWGNADYLRVIGYLSPLDDGYDLWSDVDEKYREDAVDAKDEEKDETVRQGDDDGRARYEIRKNTGDDTILGAFDYDKPNNDVIFTTRHIVESLGKLLMVRRKLRWPRNGTDMNHTLGADLFEANITTGAWMPITDGLGGQALFISKFHCKATHACGEVEKDAVYFVDTADVLNMKSRIISQPQRDLLPSTSMWIFPPEIVL